MTIDGQQIDRVSYGLTYFEGPTNPFQRLHIHNEVEVGILSGGSVTAMFGGKTLRIESGESILFWASQPHGPVEISGHPYTSNIAIPLTQVLTWDLPEKFRHQLLGGTVFHCPAEKLGPNTEAYFLNWKALILSGDGEQIKLALLELQSFFFRIALMGNNTHKDPALLKESGSLYFQQMAAFIAEHHCEEITIQDVIAETRLHPKYAMRVFKKQAGCTLLEYLTRQRISTAKHLLITTKMNTAEIAFACGFGSVSRFYSAFSSNQSQPPGQFRKEHRGYF